MAAKKKRAGGRPPKEDRAAVKSSVLTLKLSPDERALLEALVEARADELERLTGERVAVTMASYLRALIEREGKKALGPSRA